MSVVKLEVCIDSLESALAAQEGGANRVELCGDLASDGTTPSYGLIAEARKQLTIGLHVMIRPRGGDFCYSELEFEIMKRDIEQAKALHVDGVVFGILIHDNRVDISRMKALIDIAKPMKITFHRAFDIVQDPMQAMEEIIQLRIDRILTSGQKPTAREGLPLIKQLVDASNDRIVIMPASGVTLENINFILNETKTREIHVGSAVSEIQKYPNAGIFNSKRRVVTKQKVHDLLNCIHHSAKG